MIRFYTSILYKLIFGKFFSPKIGICRYILIFFYFFYYKYNLSILTTLKYVRIFLFLWSNNRRFKIDFGIEKTLQPSQPALSIYEGIEGIYKSIQGNGC